MAEKGLNILFYLVAGLGIFLALVYQLGLKSLFLYAIVGMVGFCLGLGIILCSGNRKKSVLKPQPPVGFNVLVTKVMEVIKKKKRRVRKVVVSRSVDKSVKEVFELVVRDFIISWYRDIGKDEDMFLDALEEDVWEFVDNLQRRLRNVDKVHLLTSDIVLKLLEHFQMLKETSYIEGEEPKPFYLHPCLATEATETEFLREAVEVLLVLLLPERLAGCETARHLLREAFTCTVFRPAVDTICDPHYINETFLSYLDYRVQLAERHKKKYAYAASYEDFIQMIGECNDIDELLQMRYHILTEIMHATILDDLKKTRKLEADKIPKGNSKSDLLRARNLKRYINQCKVAKTHCEKRVQLVGGAAYGSYFTTSSTETGPKPHQRLLSLDEILADEMGRDLLKIFLTKEGKEDLLHFWVSVESMKTCKKPQDQHMKATDIYQTFIASKSIIDVDKKIAKDMGEYLVSNKGPEAFYDAQTQIYQSLDEEFYPAFLVSETYEKLMEKLGIEDNSEIESGSEVTKNYEPVVGDAMDSSSQHSMQDQSDRIEATLMQLEDKLKQKTQAVVNFKKSHSANAKMQEDLESEIEDLKNEKKSLELYIERIDLWWEHVGKWRTDICLPEVPKDLENFILHFKLVIHPIDPSIKTCGWVVLRKLEDFHLLQDRLKDCSKWVKKAKLPSISKRSSRSLDQKELEKMKDSLQRFLSAVLQDDTLRQSEALFSLIIPTPKLLKDAPPVAQKRSLFSLSSIFKSSVLREEDAEDEEEEEGSSDRKDSIAEPLYELISEIFELHGTFKWLRRSLIIFVQATFGGTINKEIQKGIDWIFFGAVASLLRADLQRFYVARGDWKGNARGSPSKELVTETRKKARQKFLENLPDFLQNLLGKKNSRLGALKIFDAFQDSRTNKHMFYPRNGDLHLRMSGVSGMEANVQDGMSAMEMNVQGGASGMEMNVQDGRSGMEANVCPGGASGMETNV
ncbi:putative sorting nexin-25 [Apostichopus japonicus]|uniref:Putative sorting nexin-25 n=1 Tax=Stichopus japonicus TaxID=307972 RepID=A0A2G8JKZ0_STIJA|nr:putative sorting nexin-25 [Apostichopus japonicus]